MKLTYKFSSLISISLIIIFGLITYSNSLNNEFVWDDNHLIKDNQFIKDPSNFGKVFLTNIGAGAGIDRIFYRPIQIFSYMIDYTIWKLNPFGYHLTNTFLHILVSLSLFWLINIFFNNKLLSLLTAVLYVVHPIHTEAVTYISGRSDSLAFLFMLLSFIFYHKKINSKRVIYYVILLICYAAALLSRENVLIFPFILLIYHNIFRIKIKPVTYLSVLGISIAYLLNRVFYLESLATYSISTSSHLVERLPGIFVAITNYAKLLIFPFNLHMEYGQKTFSFMDPQAISGILIIVSMITYAFLKRKDIVIYFSIAWFLLTFLPISNIYPINAYMAEHWMYIPSVGFFIILSNGLISITKKQKIKPFFLILSIGIILYFACLTFVQNNYWQDPQTFYERTLKFAPDSWRANFNLGNIYAKNHNYKEAIILYKKSLDNNSDNIEAYNNLANSYMAIGDNTKAINIYKKTIETNPKNIQAYNNLGNAFVSTRNLNGAYAAFRKVIELNPKNPSGYNNLSNIYLSSGQFKKAVNILHKLIAITPNDINAYYNLALAYSNLNQNNDALNIYKKIIKLKPDDIVAYFNMGNRYAAMGKNMQAIVSYEKACEIDPNAAYVYYSLAVVYFREEKFNIAIQYYDKAVKLGLENSAFANLLEQYRKN